MANPFLRRPHWVTFGEREQLREAAMTALSSCSVEQHRCLEILAAIDAHLGREPDPARLIGLFVIGLHLPPSSMPVYLCDEDVAIVTLFGKLDVRFAQLLAPLLQLTTAVTGNTTQDSPE